MKNTFPSYYKNFKCIADKCPDTCCAGWEIVADGESLARYEKLTGDFADKIRSCLSVDEDGDTVFTPVGNRCPFLLESGLCEMYIKLGADSLCRTCRVYPRFTTYFGSRCESGLSFSCPEAARLMTESPEPPAFETEEIPAAPVPTDIDPEMYFTLLEVRKNAIAIIRNRQFSFEKRLCAFLRLSEAVSTALLRADYAAAREIAKTDFFAVQTSPHSASRAKKAQEKYFSDYMKLEALDPEWTCTLGKAAELPENAVASFLEKSQEFEWEYERLTVYFIFRYFMTALFGGNVLDKAKFAAVSFIIIRQIQASLPAEIRSDKSARIRVMQKYSKEIEHSEQNMKSLEKMIHTSKFYSVKNLINILEN
ncbi:MAG: flagellin lysine-N-methylase [Acutalibacteraceae bacterium]